MSEENKGRFNKGNEIGKDTRFVFGNNLSCKYTEEYCDKLLEWFSVPECKTQYKISYYPDGTIRSEEPIMLPPTFPTFELFAASIGVSNGTLKNWCSKYPRFNNAYQLAKAVQLGIAKQNAVAKLYDCNFVKFLLINDHGMAEKTESDVTYKVVVSKDIDEESY